MVLLLTRVNIQSNKFSQLFHILLVRSKPWNTFKTNCKCSWQYELLLVQNRGWGAKKYAMFNILILVSAQLSWKLIPMLSITGHFNVIHLAGPLSCSQNYFWYWCFTSFESEISGCSFPTTIHVLDRTTVLLYVPVILLTRNPLSCLQYILGLFTLIFIWELV